MQGTRRTAALLARMLRSGSAAGQCAGMSIPAASREISVLATAALSQLRSGVHAGSSGAPVCSAVASIAARRGYSSITYPPSEAFVGKPAPDFETAAVVDGEIKNVRLSDYKGKFVCLFFYPKDFTFVCPTEIIAFSDRAKEFEALDCQLIAASTDTEETHLAWIKTPRRKGGLGFMQIPILADTTKEIAAKYGCLVPELGIALRGLYIINPEGVLEQMTVNSLSVGRNVDEAKRLLQAIQYVREHGEVCPAGWTPGSKTMVADPEKSMDYFQQQGEAEEEEEIAPGLPSVRSVEEFQSLVDGQQKLVVDFYAPWCGKCRMLAPTVEALAEAHPGIKFVKFDTTAEGLDALSTQLGVKALPTFKFFVNGSEVADEVIGYKKKPLEAAVNKVAGL